MWKYTFRSEWTKFFSYHWCVLGVIGAVLVPPLTLFFSEQISADILLQSEDLIALCLRFLYLGQSGIIIAMAGFLGQEYTHSSLRTTLLANSSRMKLLQAKKAVMILSTIIAIILSSILCFTIVITKYQYGVTFDLITRFVSCVSMATISWILLGLISAYISIIAKSLIIPVAIIFPMILGLNQMLLAITQITKYLPDLAGINIFLIPEQKVFLSSLPGIIVQCMWVILFECISTNFFIKRDVR